MKKLKVGTVVKLENGELRTVEYNSGAERFILRNLDTREVTILEDYNDTGLWCKSGTGGVRSYDIIEVISVPKNPMKIFKITTITKDGFISYDTYPTYTKIEALRNHAENEEDYQAHFYGINELHYGIFHKEDEYEGTFYVEEVFE